ncbi:MAG TPA: hypothetical protein VNF75_06210 [Candidatus Dormibacteraeota bacterium]|nr:hypothetical protein [Candidatus Dormibacteraeota bacterium]
MFSSPSSRSAPITRLRRLAIVEGDFSVRTWDRFAPMVNVLHTQRIWF